MLTSNSSLRSVPKASTTTTSTDAHASVAAAANSSDGDAAFAAFTLAMATPTNGRFLSWAGIWQTPEERTLLFHLQDEQERLGKVALRSRDAEDSAKAEAARLEYSVEWTRQMRECPQEEDDWLEVSTKLKKSSKKTSKKTSKTAMVCAELESALSSYSNVVQCTHTITQEPVLLPSQIEMANTEATATSELLPMPVAEQIHLSMPNAMTSPKDTASDSAPDVTTKKSGKLSLSMSSLKLIERMVTATVTKSTETEQRAHAENFMNRSPEKLDEPTRVFHAVDISASTPGSSVHCAERVQHSTVLSATLPTASLESRSIHEHRHNLKYAGKRNHLKGHSEEWSNYFANYHLHGHKLTRSHTSERIAPPPHADWRRVSTTTWRQPVSELQQHQTDASKRRASIAPPVNVWKSRPSGTTFAKIISQSGL